ncbi:DMT family transporter [Denitrobaculum tricleocarpae]|nr:DMT family transporter [Denitrobaculum tricleocarpae]
MTPNSSLSITKAPIPSSNVKTPGLQDDPGAALKGILLALMGTALFTIMFALPKFAGPASSGHDVPGLQIAFIRYFGGFLAVLPLAVATHRKGVSLISPQPQWHLFRASLGIASVVCGVYAATHMPLANATAIGLTNGVFAIILAFIFFGERIAGLAWIASFLCLAGALVVARPSTDLIATFQSNPAAFIALIGAITMAGEMAVLTHVSRREPLARVLLYVNTVASLALAIPAFLLWEPLDQRTLLLICCMGPVAILGQICNIWSVRFAAISLITPFKYSSMVFATFIDVLFFDLLPDGITVTGCLLVAFGGLWLARLQRRRK